MKQLYTLALLICVCVLPTQAKDLYRGFILTWNGYELTGFVGDVFYNDLQSQVLFVNEYGTPYQIHPRMVRGFVYRDGDQIMHFESKVVQRRWTFLKVVSIGEGISLYKAPDIRMQFTFTAGGYQSSTQRSNEYYVQLNGRKTMRIGRIGFKRKMKRLIRKRAPILAEKIGEKGYRWRDLETIIAEYNEEYRKNQYAL